MENDPIKRGESLRLDVTPPPVVRVVLAENDSPGPLHYLIESEGFQVAGCASDDVDLARVLAQVHPDVIVLDADISATSALVAHEKAPSSELIVVWPDGVQVPSGAERVHPRLVYQDLGPAIRRAVEDRQTRHPTVVELEDEDLDAPAASHAPVDLPSSTAQRTSTRVLIGTAALIALIVLTMGASFALEGRSGPPQPTAARTTEISPSAAAGTRPSATSPPSRTGDAHPSVHAPCPPGVQKDRKTPNEHAANAAHGTAPACPGSGRGSIHQAPHQVGNRGNGRTAGHGNANTKGAGTGNANGDGAGAQTHPTHPSNAHLKASAEPPATPGSPRRGPPG